LAKTYTISREHRRTVDLRFEAFNVLNRTQFGTPNTNLSDAANLGIVRSQANAPRAVQFALKLDGWIDRSFSSCSPAATRKSVRALVNLHV